MNEVSTGKHSELQDEKQLNGLIYGIFGGLWFAIGAWGLDAMLLAQAHANLPWLKLIIGAPFLILIGALAGWLTARLDNPILGGLAWLAAGLAFVWIAIQIPFQGLSYAIGLLDANFSGLNLYPLVQSARLRMDLLFVIVGILLPLASGGFEMFFVESATRASSLPGRLFRLFLCLIIFLPLGLMVDNLVNSALRAPIVGLNQMIRLKQQAQRGELTLDQQRALGVRVLDIFGAQIDRPYTLYLGEYDPESLQESTVYVDFSGFWGSCSMVGDQALVCRPSTERYLRKLACLVEGGLPNDCGLRLLADDAPPPESVFSALDRTKLTYGIVGQRGTTVLALAQDDKGRQVQCTFRDSGDVYLQGCTPVQSRAFDALQLAPTATQRLPLATPTPATSQAELPGQAAVMVDPVELNLPALHGAPTYAISLKISDDISSFEGHAQVEATNNESVPLNALYFHLLPNGDSSYGNGSLTVSRTAIADQDVNSELSSGGTILKVPLPAPLKPGEKIGIAFDFQGVIPKDFGGSATPAGYGIYNYSDGLLALSGWYPILAVYDAQGWHLDRPSGLGDSVYADISLFNVDVSLPEGFTVAATGISTASQVAGGEKEIRFESGPAREFFIVASKDMQETSRKVDGTTINAYYPPGEAVAGSKALSVAVASFDIYESKYGAYPYTELDVVAGPMRNALGVEFPGIVMVAADMYSTPDQPEFEITVAHEVAHQWWYNVVGNDVFNEPWLDEALATYSSGVYYGLAEGPAYLRGLQNYWQQDYQSLVNQGKDDLVTGTLHHFESLPDPSVYGGIVYSKGALFFAALRQKIGDQAFFQALHDYYQSETFRVATADDLLAAFEKTSGQNLQDFYQQWLYSK